MAKEEFLGFRDEKVSQRHRLYGTNVPAVDLDFVLVEYNHARPVAIIELKMERSQEIQLGHPSLSAVRYLADMAEVPFFVAKYVRDWWTYKVIPANDRAKAFYKVPTTLSEREWVALLYRFRGLQVPQDVLKDLKDHPAEEYERIWFSN